MENEAKLTLINTVTAVIKSQLYYAMWITSDIIRIGNWELRLHYCIDPYNKHLTSTYKFTM